MKKPTPVMMVTWSFVAGGSETFAFTLARNLDRERFTPLMCAIDQGGALEAEIEKLGIPHYVMHRKPGLQFSLMLRMFRLFRRKRVKIIHTHHFNQLFYSLLGAKLCGARIIHTEHSIEAYKKPRLRKALKIMSAACYKVLAIGDDGERVLREDVGISPEKLGVIRAGVDLDAFNQDKPTARRDLDLPDDAPVAAIIARLSPEKNHRNLLEAWAKVVEVIPNAILIAAGAGPEEDTLTAEISRLNLGAHVRLLGVRRDVARLLAAADLFVLSSDREGLPVSVLEAMAASRPVVATAVGDLPTIVSHGETGLLVPAQDPSAMAAALTTLLQNPELARSMGDSGRRSVTAYGLGPMVNAHQELYDISGVKLPS